MRSVERLQSELRAELTQQATKTMEEQKKREAQDSLVRRLQKRVLLLTKVLLQELHSARLKRHELDHFSDQLKRQNKIKASNL